MLSLGAIYEIVSSINNSSVYSSSFVVKYVRKRRLPQDGMKDHITAVKICRKHPLSCIKYINT